MTGFLIGVLVELVVAPLLLVVLLCALGPAIMGPLDDEEPW